MAEKIWDLEGNFLRWELRTTDLGRHLERPVDPKPEVTTPTRQSSEGTPYQPREYRDWVTEKWG